MKYDRSGQSGGETMSVWVRSAVVAMFMSVSAGAIVVAAQAPDKVSASEGWIKTPAAGATTAMAFVEIENPTQYDVYLTSGTTDVAGKVEFRDASKGTQAQEFVIAPAYGTLSMDQKGVHVALLDLKRPLKAGDKVSLTLANQDGLKLQVAAAVRNQ
jgi:periplasmic copper chaperone A